MNSDVLTRMGIGIDIGYLIIALFVILIVLIILLTVFIVREVRLQRKYKKFMRGRVLKAWKMPLQSFLRITTR